MLRLRASSVALALALSAAVPAGAQPRQDAGALFAEGTRAFEQHSYRPALEAFARAFELSGRPQLLFNIGLCHRAMGEPAEASRAFRRYLIAVPSAPNRAQVATMIRELDAQARTLSAAAPATPAPAAIPVASAPLPVTPPPRRTSPPSRSVAPWIVRGAGGLTAAAGAVLMFTANGGIDDADRATTERARQSAIDGARTRHTVGVVLLGVGGAAVVGGLLWGLLLPAPRERVAWRIEGGPTGGGAWVGLAWTR